MDKLAYFTGVLWVLVSFYLITIFAPDEMLNLLCFINPEISIDCEYI